MSSIIHFLDLARARQSVRHYSARLVEHEKLERCLEAARVAPSACNSQPWRFVVIDDPQLKDAVAGKTFSKLVSFNRFSVQAPVLVAVISEKPKFITQVGGFLKRKEYNLIDVGIVAEHFCLQAAAEGLGTCILGWFDEKGVKKLLKVPKRKRVVLILAVGYSVTDKLRTKDRKPLDEIRTYNSF